jgi:predicted ATPase
VSIWTPDRRLRVFVSSTLGELADERAAVTRAITALRLTPVKFELGARPQPPRDVYRAYLAQSDVFIGMYWQRYGQVVAGGQISGLEEEFDLSSGLPRLLYIKEPASAREPRLANLLSQLEQQASYRTFHTSAELSRLVRDDLATLLSERFVAGAATAADATATRLYRAPGPHLLPVQTTPLIGRDQAIGEVAAMIDAPDMRLVTLTGPGGIGKTRLALAVGELRRDRFAAGVAFVPLAVVAEAELVWAAIGRAVGADLARTDVPMAAIADRLGDDGWLLILDNLEQVVDIAQGLDQLLARCAGLVILATSLVPLGLRAEREYPVPPLSLPADAARLSVKQLTSSPAVALFVDRAQRVRSDFALTDSNAAAVIEICERLEGIPLAIELAAARIRLLDPDSLLHRLVSSLDALGAGAVDLPERQRTLRTTVEWSVGLLGSAERSLLESVAVFVDGWTIEAAATVSGLSDDRALDLSEALVRHSLVQLDHTEFGPRMRMLETIRGFVAERLATRSDAADLRRRHAEFYDALAEDADRPLRGVGWSEWAARLQVEERNLAAAAGWYLDHDPATLPHMLRAVMPLWAFQEDILTEASAWVQELLPSADSLDPQGRAELLWASVMIAREIDDNAATRAAHDRLERVLGSIQDRYLHAVSELAMAAASAVVGDFDGALQEVSRSLEELRTQDEPTWTAMALLIVGSLETAVGRGEDAVRHLTEMRELANRFDNARLIAASSVQLGALAARQGRLTEARAHLDNALEQGLAVHSTRNVTLSLAAFAAVSLAEGDAERAALLLGAADGLRRRAGLRPWPDAPRRVGGDIGVRIREKLGAERFSHTLAAGSRLNQRDAVRIMADHRPAGPETS